LEQGFYIYIVSKWGRCGLSRAEACSWPLLDISAAAGDGRIKGRPRSRGKAMRRILIALAFIPALFAFSAFADDAGVKAAQSTIEAQLRAFLADDNATAYSYAAPNVKQVFPTLDIFMGMVTSGYKPVQKPQSYSFGKSEWLSSTKIAQQVFLVGPDGKDYEALYTLELQPDGVYRVTGVSLRGANALST
jgi:hypothetical protein